MSVANRCRNGYYDRMKLAEKVAILISRSGQSKAQVARRAQIQPSQISRLGSEGRSGMSLENALKLARALGVSLDYLADDAQDDPPGPLLTPSESEVLSLARLVGIDEAKRRLVLKPDSAQDDPPARWSGGAQPPLRRPVAVRDLDPEGAGGSGGVSHGHDEGIRPVLPKGRKPKA